MRKKAFLLVLVAVGFLVSCDNEDTYEDYQVARPLTMDVAQFKAQAVSVTEPEPIISSGKIYTYRSYIFVNDVNRGFHVIDNSNPTAPERIAFIKLEGNYDISVKDDKLYADSYGDLVIFDIANINDIKVSHRIVNAIYENGGIWATDLEYPTADFYDYGNYDYQKDAIVGWTVTTERRLVSEYESRYGGRYYEDSSLANTTSSDGGPGRSVGQGGSLARFKIVGDYLYVVDYSNINIFDITDVANPETLEDVQVAWDIETIFNQGDVLFIGGRQGMYIYDITEPQKPTFISEFRHGTACDPVVVDGDYAYVTLKGGNFCGNADSGLYVVDVSDLANPELKVIYPMSGPNGLGIKGDRLFVCDGEAGLKVFDKSDAPNVTEIDHFEDIFAYDVIPLDGSLLMIGEQTLYQYDYVENNIELISTFELN